jgi:hypothetical protein
MRRLMLPLPLHVPRHKDDESSGVDRIVGRVDSRTVSLDQTTVIENTFQSVADCASLPLDYTSDWKVSLYALNASR